MSRRPEAPTGAIYVLVVAMALVAAVAAFAQPGPGDMGFHHLENHDWYKDLKQPDMPWASCCNGTENGVVGDCRPTKAYKVGDKWMALLDGHWVSIPPNKIIKSSKSHQPFQAHICASAGGTIYCFIEKDTGG